MIILNPTTTKIWISLLLLRKLGRYSLAIILILLMIFSHCWVLASNSIDLSVDGIFREMEARTDRIYSLQADLAMNNSGIISRVLLAIQSPDKFFMEFMDKSIKVVFDGEKLWIYLESLAEVFTLDTSGKGSFLADWLKDWVNPKKIVTQITRKTLFMFFKIELVANESVKDLPASGASLFPVHAGYRMRFTPIASNFIKKVFQIGYYEMVFSKETFLPTMVAEFAPDGTLRGILHVLEYRINQPLPKEKFEFEITPNIKEIPVVEVIKQKIAQEKEELIEKVGTFVDSVINKINFWGK